MSNIFNGVGLKTQALKPEDEGQCEKEDRRSLPAQAGRHLASKPAQMPRPLGRGRVYTRRGDDGTTSLLAGKRVLKNNLRIEAIGQVDELNSWLGFIVAQNQDEELSQVLERLQQEFFIIQAALAATEQNPSQPKILPEHISWLEKQCDYYDEGNNPLDKFVLPGGSVLGASLHFARTIGRRAERALVELNQKESVSPEILKYFNRLSDLLFVLARFANNSADSEEVNPEYR